MFRILGQPLAPFNEFVDSTISSSRALIANRNLKRNFLKIRFGGLRASSLRH
jgi:hypothetical protein